MYKDILSIMCLYRQIYYGRILSMGEKTSYLISRVIMEYEDMTSNLVTDIKKNL